MHAQAQALAEARQKSDELTAILADKRKRFEESVLELTDFVNEAKAAVSVAEEKLRQAGLAYYAENPGDKKLPFGLGVRVTQSLVYDRDIAYRWASAHRTDLLMLDYKAFEKVAKTNPLAFVKIEEVPTITIPTDTAKLLTE